MNDTRGAVNELTAERHAAEALSAALKAIPGMDEETVADMVEGETNLHERLETVVDLLTHTEVMIEGLSVKIKEFEARKKRYETRRDYLRAAIEQAMLVGEIKTKEFADCTLTLARRAAGLVVTDESVIPPLYWKPSDPTLDRKQLLADLKAGTAVTGVTLGNGGVSLTVKRG